MKYLSVLTTVVGLSMTIPTHNAPSGWSYDAVCCSNKDCAKIEPEAVKITGAGYQVHLEVGDHPFVTKERGPQDYVIPFAKGKRSGDEDYHICLRPYDASMICFYAPDRGA